MPLTFQRRGARQLATTAVPAHDTTFLEGLGRACYWQHLLDTDAIAGPPTSRGQKGACATRR